MQGVLFQEEVKQACGVSVTQLILGPGWWTHLLGAQPRSCLLPLAVHPNVGEVGRGLSCHPGPESLLAGPVLGASSSSLGPEFAGFNLLFLVLTNALNFTELPSYQVAHSLQLPCSRGLDLREQGWG